MLAAHKPQIIVPFTRLRAATRVALSNPLVTAQFIPVSDSDDGYWRVLRDVWHTGQTFIIVEHDIVPFPASLWDLGLCDEPWCTQPYYHKDIGIIHNALGCTKFGTTAMRIIPYLFEQIREMSFPNDPTRSCTHWQGLDQFMLRLLERAGVKRHEHNLQVEHLS